MKKDFQKRKDLKKTKKRTMNEGRKIVKIVGRVEENGKFQKKKDSKRFEKRRY